MLEFLWSGARKPPRDEGGETQEGRAARGEETTRVPGSVPSPTREVREGVAEVTPAAAAQRRRIVRAAFEIAPVLRDAWIGFAAPETDLREIAIGLIIIAFLMFEPDGLAHRWRQIKTYWKLYPFSH